MPDADALRRRLSDAGHRPSFAGRMLDRRFDRGGEFALADEVVRVRSYQQADGSVHEVLGWKGATTVDLHGYKARPEVESMLSGGAPAATLLRQLRFEVIHAIDRYVEVFDVGGAMVRLEWYPDGDTLVEVEGDRDSIEAAIVVTGLDRASFSAEPLAVFAAQFAARNGHPARLALESPDEMPAHWPR
ncbi:MAG: hypothetical protein V4558_03235 [Gemmatimonadota bacterium]